jgi:excisionase family DNA binding protein
VNDPRELPCSPEERKEIMALAARIAETLRPPVVWLTIKEAAAHIKRSEKEVYELVASGEIPSYRTGPRSIRIDKADLDSWVKTNRWSRHHR